MSLVLYGAVDHYALKLHEVRRRSNAAIILQCMEKRDKLRRRVRDRRKARELKCIIQIQRTYRRRLECHLNEKQSMLGNVFAAARLEQKEEKAVQVGYTPVTRRLHDGYTTVTRR